MTQQIDLIKKLFQSLKTDSLKDQQFLEHFIIPHLGLNDEILEEQPKELNQFYGTGLGLKIWQYPNQFSKYLIFISNYSKKIKTYIEIGCRNGGTFALHNEYLTSTGANLNSSTAIDIIDEPEFLISYREKTPYVNFLNINSFSEEFKLYIDDKFFDLAFIDGDHSYDGVKNDSELLENKCNIKVFHDTVNQACPGVGKYWNEIKLTHTDIYDFHDFIDQYESVDGTYLGIGVAVRKKWITI